MWNDPSLENPTKDDHNEPRTDPLEIESGCTRQARDTPIVYPIPPRSSDVVDVYHGISVGDPLRPLEETDSPETLAWTAAQNRLTEEFLAEVPNREAIRERLVELHDYPSQTAPWRKGDRYFFHTHDGKQNFYVLHVADEPCGPSRVLLDPNALSPDGTITVQPLEISNNGHYLVYSLATGGSDWRRLRIRRVASGTDLEEVLEDVKFTPAAWDKDGKGFFYCRFPKAAEGRELIAKSNGQQVYYHRLGTDQSADRLVFARPENPDSFSYPTVTNDGRYLLINVYRGSTSESEVYALDLEQGGNFVGVFQGFGASYEYVHNQGSEFFFTTNQDAPRERLIKVDLNRLDQLPHTVIPEGEHALSGIKFMGGRFIVSSLRDAQSAVSIHDLDGRKVCDVDLPPCGSATQVTGESEDQGGFFQFESFALAPSVFHLDVSTGEIGLVKASEAKIDPEQFEVNQVWYESKDGTRVPMFLVHKRGLELDGNNPTLLYGYGGFEIALEPEFCPEDIAFIEMGGVYAQPSLRGGSEYGEEWHRAGKLDLKQNVFDDFEWAARWLIENRYTSPAKLAINGRSNGGLLVGAALNQNPSLYGGAIAEVGVMDMLRYHKFTSGFAWIAEYGSSDDPRQFENLYRYSPLHNLREGVCYPPTFVLTADRDDRVPPLHSFKYAARLQQVQAGKNPCLLRVESSAGHGFGTPLSKLIAAETDKLTFLSAALEMNE